MRLPGRRVLVLSVGMLGACALNEEALRPKPPSPPAEADTRSPDAPTCPPDEREPDNSLEQLRDKNPLTHIYNHGPLKLTGLTACPGDEDWIPAYADCCETAGAIVRWDPAVGPLEVELVDDQGAALPPSSPEDIIERRPGEVRWLRAQHGGRFIIRVRASGAVPVPYSVDVFAPVFVR